MADTFSLPASVPTISVVLAGLYLVSKWATSYHSLSHIPTVGYSAPLLSYLSALRFLVSGRQMLEEGYEKYKSNPGVFKIATMEGWMVIAASRQCIDDVRRAPDDQLSFMDAVARFLQIRYTLGPEIETNHYHVAIVRTQLTRNLGTLFDAIRDEIACAFDEVLPTKADGNWVKVPTIDVLQRAVCRTSNRLFVGLPLCRNEDYIKLNIEFTLDVVIGSQILRFFPDVLKLIVGKALTKVPRQLRRARVHLEPLIEERYRMMEQHGDGWEDKPNDFLQWLIDNAEGEEKSARLLAQRILTVNFAAIHTSSQSMTQILYHLAANPQYADVMREEVMKIVSAEGWTKIALQKMRKVDSFIKEVQRLDGLGLATMGRIARRSFAFSNGVTIPAGGNISCIQREVHHDGENYENPDIFDPWRFANIRDEEGEGTKHQLVATSIEFLNFGHGRHACPGRFFAANELKAMLAHIVLNYDVKFEDDVGFPPYRYFGFSWVPQKVDLLFRKRDV